MSVGQEAFIAGVGPALVWLILVVTRDRYRVASFQLIVKLFALAIIPLGLSAVIELVLGLDPTAATVTLAVTGAIGVGFVEEAAKAVTLFVITGRDQAAMEPIDAMVYASSIALGFAAFETTLYIVAAYQLALLGGESQDLARTHAFLVVAPLRAFTGALGHMSFTGIIGHAFGMFRVGLGSPAAIGGAFLIAVTLHAAYDWLLGLEGNYWLGAIAVLVVGLIYYTRLLFDSANVSRILAKIREEQREAPAHPS